MTRHYTPRPDLTARQASVSVGIAPKHSNEGATVNRVDRTYELIHKGWTTSMQCALKGGCLSLSQRVSDWRALGMNIEDKWVKTEGGARIKAYRLVFPKKVAA